MKTKINLRCVASRYAARDEQIIEFSHPNGGGLISFLPADDGGLRVDVYCIDRTVEVDGPEIAVNASAFRELLEACDAVTTLAQRINDIQHAGQTVWPETWAELYHATNSAKAAIAKATP